MIFSVRVLLLLVLGMLCISQRSVISGGCVSFPNPSISVEEAKKRGTFVREVEVSPTQLAWDGRIYKIHECWEEKPPLKAKKKFKFFSGIAFTLEVDGKYPSDLSYSLLFAGNNGCSGGKYPVHFLMLVPPNTEIVELPIDYSLCNKKGIQKKDAPRFTFYLGTCDKSTEKAK